MFFKKGKTQLRTSSLVKLVFLGASTLHSLFSALSLPANAQGVHGTCFRGRDNPNWEYQCNRNDGSIGWFLDGIRGTDGVPIYAVAGIDTANAKIIVRSGDNRRRIYQANCVSKTISLPSQDFTTRDFYLYSVFDAGYDYPNSFWLPIGVSRPRPDQYVGDSLDISNASVQPLYEIVFKQLCPRTARGLGLSPDI